MTTATKTVFLFEELSSKAKTNAIDRYGEEQAIEEEILSLPDGSPWASFTAYDVFVRMGWRYDRYGNRLRV